MTPTPEGADTSPSAASPTPSSPPAPPASPAASASPESARSTASTSPNLAPPEWAQNVSIGAGTIIWYYQPFLSGVKNNIDLFFVNLLFDGHVGDFGLHIEPRFRDTKLRPHFGGTSGGTAWVQEAYASVTLPGAVLKVGKSYSHFALFWDNSFYGNVQVYDGLKLDPDFGLSLEGATNGAAPLGVRYWLQYFVVDGQTNVALDGRETFTIPGARRRNQAILRVEPFVNPIFEPIFKPIFSAAPGISVKVGLSGEFLQADLPAPTGKKDVYRGAGDVTVSVGPWSVWSELIRQNGQTVVEFPIAAGPATSTDPATPGQASRYTDYFLFGTEFSLGKVSARYNLSYGGYRDLAISEWMHVPAIGVAVNPKLTFLAEYVYWRRYTPAADVVLDRSLNVTLQAHL